MSNPPIYDPQDEAAAAEALKLDHQLCFALYSATLSFNKVYRKLLGKLDLTYPQYLVMMVLWEKDDVRVSDICNRLFLETTTMTPLLKRLEGRGLIHRRRSPEDERQVLITLSDQGRAMKRDAADVPLCVSQAVGMDLEDMLQLQKDLLRLRGNLFDAA